MDEKHSVISCKIAARLLSERLEKKLPPNKEIALKAHLTICLTCTYLFRQLAALRNVFKNYNKAVCKLNPPPDSCLSAAAKKRIKDLLDRKYPCSK